MKGSLDRREESQKYDELDASNGRLRFDANDPPMTSGRMQRQPRLHCSIARPDGSYRVLNGGRQQQLLELLGG